MIDRVIEFSVRHKGLIFFCVAVGCAIGYWSLATAPLDALPDLGDTQVIVYSRWDRSPDLIEAHVTYPIITAMLGAPRVKAVRGFSDFGYSYVYIIFDDGTDPYWARSRTLEYLSGILPALPEGAKSEIGADATTLGWVYQYALVDPTHQHSLAQLRSLQDWYLRYQLKSVPGVAEVAPVGGFTQQYQVNVDPHKLLAYGISLTQVVDAVRGGNEDAAGRLLEFGGTEYMVRGRGYAASIQDFREIVVATPQDGSPVRIKDIGDVTLGPDMRRGIADLNGEGEVVSGIVVMRNGENALQVIDRVKAKLKTIETGLPAGVKIVPVYDRSALIHRTISNTRQTVLEVVATVVLIILVFLWHFPSAAIPLVTMPVAVLIAFIPCRLLGVSVNVMSLAGIAIAFGELIDASIIVVEQTHKRLDQAQSSGSQQDTRQVVLSAIKEVARPTFFCLLIIAVSFLPILTLEAEEGRMFRPLAFTKSSAMIVAALLAVTLDPALRMLLTNVRPFHFRPDWLCRLTNTLLVGRIQSEDHHPVSRVLMRAYEPVVAWTLRRKWLVLATALVLVVLTVPVFLKLGSEFMPSFDEGTILYMPTTMPGISISQAKRVLQVSDTVLKQFPEVEQVLGKAGRAETPRDPAPLSMQETVIVLKPRSQWRHVPTWYSSWSPEWLKPALRHLTPDVISSAELVEEMNAALHVPGISNSWTMPIKGRLDMLSTGIRTPVGLKISGADPAVIEDIGSKVESILSSVAGTRTVFAEHTQTGYYLDIQWHREELARYGLSVETAQRVLQSAIGGDNVSTVFHDLERYPVNVRYMRDFRSDIDALNRVLVPAGGARQIPIGELATISMTNGPAMIRNENGLLTGYVYVDLADRDPSSYIREASLALRDRLKPRDGYTLTWSGQYEAMQRVRNRLWVVVPLTLAVIVVLLYVTTHSVTKTVIVLLAVPFSAIGAIWLLYLLDYRMSIAVWVGLIGLLGIDAETGVFMLLYLDIAFEEARRRGRLNTLAELREAIMNGAAKRLRPKFMTFATTCIGLFPILWSTGTGSEIMKRIAAPMVGGIFTSFLLELLVYPAVYELWKRRALRQCFEDSVEPAYKTESSLVAS